MALSYDLHDPDPKGANGRTVVLLHGLSSSRETYRQVVPHLSAAGWRVCNADLRGHGGSPHLGGYLATNYAADVAALIEGPLGGSPVVVIGHSLGGLAASTLAQTAPALVTAICIEDPPLYEGDDAIRNASPAAAFFPQLVAQIRTWQAAGTDATDVAAALADQPSPHGGTAGERLGAEHIAARARALLAFDPEALDAAIDGSTWNGYRPGATMACPVLVLRADPAVGAVFLPDHGDQYQAALPHAQIEMVSGQAHGIHEDPDGLPSYLAALDRFLAEAVMP